MYRIRLHGRGGHGIKTASRVLGTAFFMAGFEVQDAPRYGAERRGAPIFAYVRADRRPIAERGAMHTPDLVVVADDTLVGVPVAGVLQGLDSHSILMIDSVRTADVWRARLNLAGPIVALPRPDTLDPRFLGAACAGAAAGLIDALDRGLLEAAIAEEAAGFGADMVAKSRDVALAAYDSVTSSGVRVCERPAVAVLRAAALQWIELPHESGDATAPAIHAAATSVEVRTGLWRTLRPVVDRDRCRHCWWVCSTFCPDDAIAVNAEGEPVIDYDHCKGCMICVAQCPPHAIAALPEAEAAAAHAGEDRPAPTEGPR